MTKIEQLGLGFPIALQQLSFLHVHKLPFTTKSPLVIRIRSHRTNLPRVNPVYNSYFSPRHHLLYCTVCARSITNVLAQCRFHRISKMTSSNPHPTSPPRTDSLISPTFISLSLPPVTHTTSLSRPPLEECSWPP